MRSSRFIKFSLLILISILPALAAQVGYQIDFAPDTSGLKISDQVREQIYDAYFVLIDFPFPLKKEKLDLYPLSTRRNLWNDLNRKVTYLPRPFDEKISMLKKIVEREGNGSDVAIVLARCYYKAGKKEDALKIVSSYLESAKTMNNYYITADFYHSVLMPSKELEVLNKALSDANDKDKIDIYNRMISIIADYEIQTEKLDSCYANVTNLSDDKKQVLEKWYAKLLQRKEYAKLEKLISDHKSKYAALATFLNIQQANLYFDTGKAQKAIDLYYNILNPADKDGNFKTYFESLRKAKRYTDTRRILFKKWQNKTLTDTDRYVLIRMYIEENRYNQTKELLREIKDQLPKLPEAEKLKRLKILAVDYSLTGNYEDSARAYYELYKRTDSKDQKASYLLNITEIVMDRTRFFDEIRDNGISGWLNVIKMDAYPSLFGGISSLLYNKQEIDLKAQSLVNAWKTLANKKIVEVIRSIAEDQYPDSELTKNLLIWKGVIYTEYKRYDEAIRAADEFIKKYPDHPLYKSAIDTKLIAYKALKNHEKLAESYDQMLKWASDKKKDDIYRTYFGKRIDYLRTEKKLNDAISLYWNEIRRRPNDKELYQNFISFTESYRFHNEELKIYQRALQQFKESSWTHKIARWYLKRKMWNEFTEFSNKMMETFDDQELNSYFQEVVDSYYWDKQYSLSYNLYRYSLDRFPFEEKFLRGVINYYYSNNKMYSERSNMESRYFFICSNCRNAVLKNIFKKSDCNLISSLTGKDSLVTTSSNHGLYEDMMSTILRGYCASWLSYFEEALTNFEKTVTWYPDNLPLNEYLATLYRSLEKTEQAIGIYQKLAESAPRNTDYITKAGECLADRYQIELAINYWQRITSINPGDKTLHEELATLYWDYYLFDLAEKVFLNLRKKTDDPTVYSDKLAAVYESNKKYDKAVEEYINGIGGINDYYYWEKVERLIYLTDRRKLKNSIIAAFDKKIKDSPNNNTLFNAYSYYLERIGDEKEKARLYGMMIDITEDIDILSNLYYYFQDHNDSSRMAKTLLRKLDLFEEMDWVLDDAISYFERIGNFKEADKLIETKIQRTYIDAGEMPYKYIAALRNAQNYYMRNNNYTKAFEVIKRGIDFAGGEDKRQMQLTLAKLYIQKNMLDDASVILRGLVETYPERIDYFNALAEIYTARKDFKGLVGVYGDAIKRVREKPIQPTLKKDQIIELRRGLIKSYTELKRYFEAADQYIEIINAKPTETYLTEEAFNYSKKYNQLERLKGYYEKLVKSAYKDYRWQLILANIHRLNEEYSAAITQLENAIKNEPQMIDIYKDLVDLQIKLSRFGDAAKTYDTLYKLSEKDYNWKLQQAEMLVRINKRKEAIAVLTELLKDKPQDHRIYFKIARILEKWGEIKLALQNTKIGLEQYMKKATETYLERDDMELIVGLNLKSGRTVEIVFELFDLQKKLNDIKESNRSSYDARWYAGRTVEAIQWALESRLGEFCRNYASDSELNRLSRKLSEKLTTIGIQNAEVINTFAASAGLTDIQEKTLQYLANRFEQNRATGNYYTNEHLNKLVNFYSGRMQFNKLQVLIGFFINRYKMERNFSDRHKILADTCKLTGNKNMERDSLEKWLYWRWKSNQEFYFNNWDYNLERYYDLAVDFKKENIKPYYTKNLEGYVGMFLNYLLSRGEKNKAIKLLEENPINQPQYWILSKKADILIFSKQFDKNLADQFKSILRLQPIKNRLSTTEPELKPSVWFKLAMKFSELLALINDNSTIDRYIPSAIEELPRSEEKQILTGDYYMKMKRYDKAADHYNLALQLSPASNLAFKNLGEAYFKSGVQDKAFSTWKRIIDSPSIDNHILYMNILAEHGKADTGINAALDYLNSRIEKGSAYKSLENYMKQIKTAAEKYNVKIDINSYLTKMLQKDTGNIDLIKSIIASSDLLHYKEKIFYYEELIKLLSKSNLKNEIKNKKGEYLDYLYDNGEYLKASELINDMIAGDKNFSEYRYLAKAIKINNRLGTKPIVPEISGKYINASGLQAYRIIVEALKEENLEPLRNQWALDMYDYSVNRMKSTNSTDLYGYAEELFKAGKRSEAEKIVTRLITIRTDNTQDMKLAATLLGKYGSENEALKVRNNLMKIMPEDFDNIYETIRLLVKTNKITEGLKLSEKLLNARSAPRSLIDRAIDYIVKEIESGSDYGKKIGDYCWKAQAKAGTQDPGKTINENFYIAAAAFKLKTGDKLEAKVLLTRSVKLMNVSARSSMMLAKIWEDEKNADRAISCYLDALVSDPKNKTIRSKLFDLYFDKKEYLQAIKLTEEYDYTPRAYDLQPQTPDKFISIYNAFDNDNDNDKRNFIEKMKQAARKIGSLHRVQYYHLLIEPLVRKDANAYKKWRDEKDKIDSEIKTLVDNWNSRVFIRWEL